MAAANPAAAARMPWIQPGRLTFAVTSAAGMSIVTVLPPAPSEDTEAVPPLKLGGLGNSAAASVEYASQVLEYFCQEAWNKVLSEAPVDRPTDFGQIVVMKLLSLAGATPATSKLATKSPPGLVTL